MAYVAPSARRLGVAQALMAAVSVTALERGWCRVELFVEAGLLAIDFYRSIGMVDLDHWHLRLDGPALTSLASFHRPQP